jgi:pimeloyl-ACP methyl ester carboxylesterase
MSSVARFPSLRGEARYGLELARLVIDGELRSPRRSNDAPPVLLIPGFMAGDASLAVLATWLRRRGHRVKTSGIRMNIGCAGASAERLQAQLRDFAEACDRPVFLIGQSRGGVLARCLATREPAVVCGLVTMGSPVLDPLAVSPNVLRTVRSVARLGDVGLPGVFSTRCAEGDCCAGYMQDVAAPLPPGLTAVAVHSRSDAIVDWRACLDPHARHVEVNSSHCGMSVNPEVYRVLEQTLAAQEKSRDGPAAKIAPTKPT